MITKWSFDSSITGFKVVSCGQIDKFFVQFDVQKSWPLAQRPCSQRWDFGSIKLSSLERLIRLPTGRRVGYKSRWSSFYERFWRYFSDENAARNSREGSRPRSRVYEVHTMNWKWEQSVLRLIKRKLLDFNWIVWQSQVFKNTSHSQFALNESLVISKLYALTVLR